MTPEQEKQIIQQKRDLVERSWDGRNGEQELRAFYASPAWREYLHHVRGRRVDYTARSASYGA